MVTSTKFEVLIGLVIILNIFSMVNDIKESRLSRMRVNLLITKVLSKTLIIFSLDSSFSN